ncbi:MAG: hypothetical protein IPK00_13615 [Deltaproteobacteria bacterium]|nr:hypothetical protein [Deltaproteobacteria bacterium]
MPIRSRYSADHRPSIPHRVAARTIVAFSLLVLTANLASAFTIEPSRLVYQEDFQSELDFPTTPEVDTIGASGLSSGGGFASFALSGTTLVGSFSVTGTGSTLPESDTKQNGLALAGSTIGSRSFALRGRIRNILFNPAPTTTHPRLAMGIQAEWVTSTPGYRIAFAGIGFGRPASGAPLDASFGITTFDAFDIAGIQTVSTQVSAAQVAELPGYRGAATIDFVVDHEAATFTAILDQSGWAPIEVSLPIPLDVLGVVPGGFVLRGQTFLSPPPSFESATGSVDFDLFEVYVEPETFHVDTPLDRTDLVPGNGACSAQGDLCSLRAAIQESNALPGLQRIIVPAGLYALTREGADEDAAATGDLDITDDVEIAGAGAADTIVDGSVARDRVFDIRSGGAEPDVSISGLTIRGGAAVTPLAPTGGGIENAGALTLSDCAITGNLANLAGGIMNRRSLVMDRCLVADNEARALGFTNARAGGIASASTSAGGSSPIAEIRQSAIVDNLAPVTGGLELGNCLSARIENTTIAGNQDDQVSVFNCNATFHHATVTSASGTALAAGTFSGTHFVEFIQSAFEGTPACILGPTLTVAEEGFNASSDASCGLTKPEDVVDVPLGLSALVRTPQSAAQFPLPESPLIDAGSEGSECLADDQLGTARTIDGDGIGADVCDLGAIEIELPEPGFTAGIALGVLGIAGRMRRLRRAHRSNDPRSANPSILES